MGWGVVSVVAFLWVSFSACASYLEDWTTIPYQNDAHSGRDAPDVCNPQNTNNVQLNPYFEEEGLLVPVDDEDDYYSIHVWIPNVTIHLHLDPSEDLPDSSPVPDFDLRLLDANCNELLRGENPGSQPEHLDRFSAVPATFFVHVYLPPQSTGASFSAIAPDPSEVSVGGLARSPSLAQNCHPPCHIAGYTIQWFPAL